MPTGSVVQPESDILPNRSAVDFRKQYFSPGGHQIRYFQGNADAHPVYRTRYPSLPMGRRIRGDKHAKGTDSALEADTAGQPQVQRRDFVSISPSRGALDWSQERQAVSLLSTSHSLPLPSGSFFSGFVNSPLLQFEPPNTAVTTVGKSRTDFFFSSCSSTQDVQRYFPPASAFTTFISCHHKIPQSPLPKSPDSPKSSFWLKGSYLPSRALFQNPKRCGTF